MPYLIYWPHSHAFINYYPYVSLSFKFVHCVSVLLQCLILLYWCNTLLLRNICSRMYTLNLCDFQKWLLPLFTLSIPSFVIHYILGVLITVSVYNLISCIMCISIIFVPFHLHKSFIIFGISFFNWYYIIFLPYLLYDIFVMW